VLTLFWAVFIGIITWCLTAKGYLAFGMEGLKDLATVYDRYESIEAISTIKWYTTITQIVSTKTNLRLRLIVMMLVWSTIYLFKELFSISIVSIESTTPPVSQCVGNLNNEYVFNNSNWLMVTSGYYIPYNLTQIKTLLNSRSLNNIAMLGDGIFTVIAPETTLVENQTITANKISLNCIEDAANSLLVGTTTNQGWIGPDINTTYFGPTHINTLINFYGANVDIINTTMTNGVDANIVILLLASNSFFTMLEADINHIKYQQNAFVFECRLEYNIISIPINQTSMINNTHIGNYSILQNNTSLFYPNNTASYLYKILSDTKFMTIYDYPDILVNTFYNETINTTMAYVNDIFAAHMLSVINTSINACELTNQQIYTISPILLTKISLGYLLTSIIITIASLGIIILFSLHYPQQIIYTNPWALIYTMLNPSNDKLTKQEFIQYLNEKSNHLLTQEEFYHSRQDLTIHKQDKLNSGLETKYF
jgi:hypothetical protein